MVIEALRLSGSPRTDRLRVTNDAVLRDCTIHGFRQPIVNERYEQTAWPADALVLDLANPNSDWRAFPQPFQRRARALAAQGQRIFCIGGMDSDNKPTLAANFARAHSVWIEPLGGQLVIRFAEPDGNFEKSPGHLDSLSSPMAFVLFTNAPKAVDAPKRSDQFQLVGATSTNTACVETSFTVRGGRKPNFYARWQLASAIAAPPLLTLDLVPTSKSGEVRVYFRDKPLGGIKATLRTPDEKEKELTPDGEGSLRFTSTQSGQHLLTIAHHREPLAGFHLGRAYEQTSHNAALTWRQ